MTPAELKRWRELMDRRGYMQPDEYQRAVQSLVLEVDHLLERQTVHLEQIRTLSQTIPLESEVAEALNQRGALLARIGTLESELKEYQGANKIIADERDRQVDRATPTRRTSTTT